MWRKSQENLQKRRFTTVFPAFSTGKLFSKFDYIFDIDIVNMFLCAMKKKKKTNDEVLSKSKNPFFQRISWIFGREKLFLKIGLVKFQLLTFLDYLVGAKKHEKCFHAIFGRLRHISCAPS